MRFSRKLHICAIRESEALTLDLEPSKSSSPSSTEPFLLGIEHKHKHTVYARSALLINKWHDRKWRIGREKYLWHCSHECIHRETVIQLEHREAYDMTIPSESRTNPLSNPNHWPKQQCLTEMCLFLFLWLFFWIALTWGQNSSGVNQEKRRHGSYKKSND